MGRSRPIGRARRAGTPKRSTVWREAPRSASLPSAATAKTAASTRRAINSETDNTAHSAQTRQQAATTESGSSAPTLQGCRARVEDGGNPPASRGRDATIFSALLQALHAGTSGHQRHAHTEEPGDGGVASARECQPDVPVVYPNPREVGS